MITKDLILRNIYEQINKIPTLIFIILIIIVIFKILFIVAFIIIILQPTKYQLLILNYKAFMHKFNL